MKSVWSVRCSLAFIKKLKKLKKLAVIGNWWYDIDTDNMLNCPRSNYYFLTLNKLFDNTTSKCLSMFHCNIRSLPKQFVSIAWVFTFCQPQAWYLSYYWNETIKPDRNKYWYPQLWFLPHQPTKKRLAVLGYLSRKILMPFMDLI